MKNTIANIRILDVVRLVHGYNEQKMVQKICNRPSQIHCLNSDGTGDLSLLRYKPDFVISLFVINELYLHPACIDVRCHMYFDRGCRGRDRMVVRFTPTCAISAYHH